MKGRFTSDEERREFERNFKERRPIRAVLSAPAEWAPSGEWAALSICQPKAVTTRPPAIRTTGMLMPKNSRTCDPISSDPSSRKKLLTATCRART